ncbi:CPBP family intramembrane glutamic endopeptidase [Paenibacillus lutrae]|uniref:CPBP family intramembrane metalloprotease n=1 Tax=Paenibacillus lutrae TaxID=2078573 RepID=A0A7X3FJR5_9BACL|nr:CPBP family intramembrane glutamic endopeptidase [Paenibacillus lutrae]MVP00980.1 CPBP family intramembrane metalloprotease [Paenibacillus lutrae]
MNKRHFKTFPIILITLIVVMIAPSLLWIRRNEPLNLEVFAREVYNQEMSYQVTVLLLAGIVIGIVYVLTGKDGLAYLNLKKRDGQIRPEPWLGIKPKEGDSWINLGLNFAIVITLITAGVIYFQLVHGGRMSLDLYPGVLLVIVFALTNAFAEEIIFRFSFVAVVSKLGYSPYLAQGLAAAVFGVIHFFGTPSGIPGALMAAFLGWILAKSMIETKGFFWALSIHFLQDVVIFTAVFRN